MNARILELIKNPAIIQKQDLELLDSELKNHPYLQNLRAIHLYGTHQFDTENYQKELTVTAAYTTDKKILYQFINKKASPSATITKDVEKKPAENEIAEENPAPIFKEIIIDEKPVVKPVFIEGQLNRILFEGEEDFLERQNEKIDMESTTESGKIVTHILPFEEKKSEVDEKPVFNEVADAKSFSTETVVEIPVPTQETEPEDEFAISFHGSEEFLPEVQITTPNFEEKYVAPKPQLSKQELEIQLLIAEVEAKVQALKKEKTPERESDHNHDVNFSESQRSETETLPLEIIPAKAEETSVDVSRTPTEEVDAPVSTPEIAVEKPSEKEKTSWKPMKFLGNTPDSLLDQKTEIKQETAGTVLDIPREETAPQAKTEITDEEERPVLNVSFLSQNVSPIVPAEIKNDTEEILKTEINSEDSNIPNFINTWQTWLKIERKETFAPESPTISKEEIKNTVIEKFIEKEPKISKLKDDSDFVVKEKGTNISHLMTETLANLYVEQKLYTKAIKGYETLAGKHPHKEEIFKQKIIEIKELRKNP